MKKRPDAARAQSETPIENSSVWDDFSRYALPLLMFFYFVLTTILIARVPMNAAPDESAHLEYVQYLSDHARLPVFAAKGANFSGYEFHQPPLYYALCAPLWKVLPTVAQGLACRFVSLLCATATLWFLWHAVLLVFPRRRDLAIGATFFAALWPLHSAVGASAGNDALADLICAAIFWSVARAANRYSQNAGATFVKDAVLVGALAGLGLLTKNTTLLVGIASIGALFWLPKLAQSSTRFGAESENASQNEDVRLRENQTRNAKSRDAKSQTSQTQIAPTQVETRATKRDAKTQNANATDSRDAIENELSISSTRFQESALGSRVFGVGAALLAMFLVCGWWLARNQLLYGDVLAARVFDEAFRNSSPRPAAFFVDAERNFGQTMTNAIYGRALFLILFCTFWGVFGGPNNALRTLNPFGSRGPREEAFAFLPLMFVLLLLTIFALWGLSRALPRWKNAPLQTRIVLGSWICGAVLVALALANFNLIQFQAQARYLHPALVPIALGFALGWRTLFASQRAWIFANVVFAFTAFGLTLCNVLLWRALN